MNRIEKRFAELRVAGRKGFIPFVTAGDPDLETSTRVLRTLARNGADVIELGVPFSDPMADGPTIQASSQRALANGVTLADVLELARDFRTVSDIPIVLFSYLNPIFRYGYERLAAEASEVGIDGILVTDAVDEEAAEISAPVRQKNIDLIPLIAPTTTDERLRRICAGSTGFIYAVSRAGVTGARNDSTSTAEALVERARRFTELPIAVGFGISTREQIADVWRYADAAVVGSAIVARIEAAVADGNDSAGQVERFVRGLLP